MSARTGTQLFAKATIADDSIPAPVADQTEINGGWHSVADTAARDATALQYRRWGMVVNVENDSDTTNNKQWVLTRPAANTADDDAAALMNNANWAMLSSAPVINYRKINGPANVLIDSADDIVLKNYDGNAVTYTYTLPPANSVNAGKQITVADINGNFIGSYGIIVAASAGDNINGLSSLSVNHSPFFQIDFVSNGVNSWNYNENVVKYTSNTRNLDMGNNDITAVNITGSSTILTPNLYFPYTNLHITPYQLETGSDFGLVNIGGDGGSPGWAYRHADGRMFFYGLLQASQSALIGSSGSISPYAVLQLDSTSKGFLPPRMTTTQRTAITTPDEGLTVYDLTQHKLFVFDGTAWQAAW